MYNEFIIHLINSKVNFDTMNLNWNKPQVLARIMIKYKLMYICPNEFNNFKVNVHQF